MKRQEHERGFIALMSVMVISAVLLVLLFTLGASSFLNRFDVLDSQNKRVSLALAEACVNMAMINIAQDSDYGITPSLPSAGECVGVSDACVSGSKKICKICQVTIVGSEKEIITRAAYGGTYTNLRIRGTLGSTNFSVSRWEEFTPYSGSCTTTP